MSTPDERAAENEALWREVNENVEAAAMRLEVAPGGQARFVVRSFTPRWFSHRR